MRHLSAISFMQELPKVLSFGGAIYHRATTPLAHVGVEEDFNEDYCIANSIPVFRVQRTGGTIVSNIGDFDFVIVSKSINPTCRPVLLEQLFQLVLLKGLKASWQNNDLLVEGYKVASYSTRKVEGGIYLAMHLSMSVNMDLIKAICKKPMIKVPKGLNDFGIYEKDILKLLATN